MEKILNPIITAIPTGLAGSIDTLAYDSLSNSVLFASKGEFNVKQVSSDSLQTFDIPKFESWRKDSGQEKSGNPQDSQLRFIPSNADPKMAVTHFGHVLTSYSKKPQVAITNYGFSQGTYYWEIICPNKCAGIEIGIVKAGWTLPEPQDIKNEYIFFDFNTSTTRTICLRINFEALEISAWIKAHETKIKKAQITRGTWYPCIRISEIGNVAVLDIQCGDMNLRTSGSKIFTKSQIKKALEFCILIASLTDIEKGDGEIKAQYFQNEHEMNQFKESLGIENKIILDQEKLGEWGYRIAKKLDIDEPTADSDKQRALKWLRDNFTSVITGFKVSEAEKQRLENRFEQISNLFHNDVRSNKSLKESSSDLNIQYVKQSDCLLVSSGNQVKLVNRTNGEFNIHEIFSFNRPKIPKDQIQLYLDTRPLKLLLQRAISDFVKDLQYSDLLGLEEFLRAVEISISNGQIYSDFLQINIVYKKAKSAVNAICKFLDKSTHSEERIILLNFILAIDEALYAMIHHEDAENSLFAYWQGASSRTFTSFSRIETLSCLPDSQFNIVKLADLGLLNSTYINPEEFKLYQDAELPIDFERVAQEGEIEALIKERLKEPAKNVPLSVTLNNLPPQIHEVDTLLTSNESSFVVGVSQNGQANIWNANKALVFLSKSDFSQSLREKKPLLFRQKKEKTAPTPASLGAANPFGNEMFAGGFGGGLGGPSPLGMATVVANQNVFQEPEELDEEDEQSQATTTKKTSSKKSVASAKPNIPHTGLGQLPSNPFTPALPINNPLLLSTSNMKPKKLPLLSPAVELQGMKKKGAPALKISKKPSNDDDKESLKVTKIIDQDPTPLPTIEPKKKSIKILDPKEGLGLQLKPKKNNDQKASIPMNFSTFEAVSLGPMIGDDADWVDVNDPFMEPPVEMFGLGQPMSLKPAKKKIGSSNTGLSPELDSQKTEETKVRQVFEVQGCPVNGSVIVQLKKTPLSPLILGMCFKKEGEHQSILRLRRFAYSPSFIKKFFFQHSSETLYSLLNSQVFDSKDFDGIQRHLTEEFGLTFGTLESLFFSGSRYRNKKLGGKYFQAEWVEIDESDLELPFDQILSMSVLPQEVEGEHEVRRVLVGGKKQGEEILELCLLNIKSLKKNPYEADYSKEMSFSVEIVQTKIFDGLLWKGEEDIKIFALQNCVVLVEKSCSKMYILDNKLDIVKIEQIPFEIKNVRSFDENILALESLNDGILHFYNYTKTEEEDFGAMKVEKLSQRSQSSKDYLLRIVENPIQHLDEISSVLRDSSAGEILSGGSSFVPVYQTPFTHSFRLEREMSRISFELHLTKKLPEKTPQNKISFENTLTTSQNDFPLFERTSLDPENLKYLPIIAHQVRGSAFSQLLPAAYMTSPGTEVFASKYSNAEFVFKHLHEKTVLVDSITISSPFKSSGLGGFPVKSGLIYLTNNVSLTDLYVPEEVNNIEEFRVWNAKNPRKNQSNNPVGFFTLADDKETENFELVEKKPAKYIILKPLVLRGDLSAKDHPVEIGFFGIHGFALGKDQLFDKFNTSYFEESEKEYIDINLKIETNSGSGNEWISICDTNKIKVIDQTAKFDLSSEDFSGNQLLRVTISTPRGLDWKITSLNIQPWQVQKNIPQPLLRLNYEGMKTLRDDLLFKNAHPSVLKALSTSVCSENYPLTERRKMATILHIILLVNPSLKEFIFDNLSLEAYVFLNVLSEIKNTSFDFLALLRDLAPLQEFKPKLSYALESLLPQLFEVPHLTNSGVKIFFTLLYWTNSDTESLAKAMLELKKLCKQVQDTRLPGYKILKSQYLVPLLSFEKSLFDEGFALKITDEPAVEKIAAIESPVRCRYLQYTSVESDKYLIDLENVYHISDLKLSFPESEKLCNLRIQIWGIGIQNSKTVHNLLVSRYFNNTEGAWLHLTKQAHEPSLVKYFVDSEQLSMLGFQVNNANYRYLEIQITYSFRAGMPSLNKDSNNQRSILPIIHGKRTQGSNDVFIIEEIAKQFDVKNGATFKNTVRVTPWLAYDKFENLPGSTSTFLYEYSTGADNKESIIEIDNEYDLTAKLSSLQGELYSLIYQQRNSGFFFQNHENVLNLCARIQNIQIKLYNYHNAHGYPPQEKHQQASLALLLNLVQNLSQYILKILKQNSTTPPKSFAPHDIKEIFDTIFLYESPSYNQQLLKVLEDWVWPSLSQVEQQSLLSLIFDSYLTKSISLLSEPVDKLYSTLPVVNFLTRFVFQNPENLLVFVRKLGEANSFIGNSFALVIINQIYLNDHQSFSQASIHGDVLEALAKNLGFIINTSNLLETEKQHLLGLAVDVISNVLMISPAKDSQRFYQTPQELLKVFAFVCKNKLQDLEQKLLKILNYSCEIMMEIYDPAVIGHTEPTRIQTILSHLDEPYVAFFFGTLKELIDGVKSLTLSQMEWQDLSRIFLVHLYTILESDRRERLVQQKAISRKKKIVVKEEEEKTFEPLGLPEESSPSKKSAPATNKEEEEEEETINDNSKATKTEKNQISSSSEFLEMGAVLSKFTLDDGPNATQDCLLLSQLMMDLVNLLDRSAENKFNFADCQEHWLLILKMLSMFKITEDFGEKISLILIQAFYKTSEVVKDYIHVFVSILFKSLQIFSLDFLGQLAEISSEIGESSNETIKKSIPVDLVLTATFDRAKKVLEEKSKLQYNETLLVKIIDTLMKMFKTSLNFGGKKSVASCSKAQVTQLQRVSGLLYLIETSSSEEEQHHPLSLRKLFKDYQNNKKLIDSFLDILLQWYMFNKYEAESVFNPPVQALNSLTKKVKEIMLVVSSNEEVAKSALGLLLHNFRETRDLLSDLASKRVITGETCLTYLSQTCLAFEEIACAWIVSNSLADHFSTTLGGFDYLLEVANFKNLHRPTLSQYNEISTYFMRRFGKIYSEDYLFESLGDEAQNKGDNEGEIVEEDFAKKVKIHRTKGQKWPKYSLDLTVNKTNTQKVLSFQFDGDEYCLCLEFERLFEIKSIIVGILNYPEIGTENTVIIPEIFVDVGSSIVDMFSIGKMKLESERCSLPSNVEFFSCTFEGFSKTNGGPEEWLRSTSNFQVKFMKLRFRRPVLKLFERFGFAEGKPLKNLVVNIGFVSVSGIDVSKYGNLTEKIQKLGQTTALKVIHHMSKEECHEAWVKLAQQNFYFEKSGQTLEAVSQLMDIDKGLTSKVLLSVCKSCSDLDNWLFEQILESPNVKKYSSLISELIANEPSRIISRIEKLSKLLMKEAKRLCVVKSPEHHTHDFETFLEFVDILSMSVSTIENVTALPGHIEIRPVNIEDLVNLYEKYHKLSTNAIKITKLMIIYLFGSKPFEASDPNILIKGLLDLIYNAYQKGGKPELLHLFALISIGSPQASKWLIDHIESIFQSLYKLIQATPPNQYKSIVPVFVFLNSVIHTETIKKKFLKEKWHLQLFELFNQQNATTVLKTSDPEILNQLHKFLKNVTMDYSDHEEELAKILKQNLLRLTEFNDNSFLENFFLPLIKSEPEVPVCLFPFDYSKKKFIGDLQSQSTAPQDLNFQSKLLRPENARALNQMLLKVTKKAGTYNKYTKKKWKLAFHTTQDGDPQMQKAFKEKVSSKGPFLVLLEGNSSAGGFALGSTKGPQSRKGIVGIFSGKAFPQIVPTSKNYYCSLEKPADGLLFYYDGHRQLHFPASESLNKNIASINLFSGGGGVSFFYHTTSPIYLAMGSGQTSYCSIDLLGMRPVETCDDKDKFSILSLNQISNIEVWTLEDDAQKDEIKAKPADIVKSSNILRKDLFSESNPLNFYRPMPVYTIPSSLTAEKLSQIFFKQNIPLSLKTTQEPLQNEAILSAIHEFVKNDSQTHGIVDIEFDYEKYLESKQAGALLGSEKPHDSPNMVIFNYFKLDDGIETLITVAISNIEKWKKQELKTKWTKWITDLQNLSDFPNFFEAFIKNQESVDLLFQILANKPDDESQRSEENAKKWEEKELNSHKHIYQALADSFKMGSGVDACNIAIKTNKFSKILEALAVITKEKPRRWADNPEEEDKRESSLQTSPVKIEDAVEKKKPLKKKGVGYGTDYGGGNFPGSKTQGSDWNVNQFVEKRKMKNDQIVALINVLASIFETKGWEPPSDVLRMVCQSALLPILESAFRNGSLVDMGKESELYFAYLRLVKAMSSHKSLIPCLLELENHYRPKQRDSVFSLLSHMYDISKIFISCLSNTDYKQEEKQKEKEKSEVGIDLAVNSPGGIPIFTDPLGGVGGGPGQANNDINNAIKTLQKPFSHSKVHFGSTKKEYIFQTAITSNNPELASQVSLGLGGPMQLGGASAVNYDLKNQNESKKTEKAPKPTIFSSKITKTEKNFAPEKITSENLKKSKKIEKKEISSTAVLSLSKKNLISAKFAEKKSKKPHPHSHIQTNKTEKDEEAMQNERLAHEIIEAFEVVKKEVMIFRASDESHATYEEILKKPLPEAYRSLLGPLRFDYMDMKDPVTLKFKHYYAYLTAPNLPPQSKMIRLAQELADLSSSLPHEHTNAIFVRVDKAKVDLMKVMIMGPSQTPYAHGAFEYDVYFDDSYPNGPPKVNLMTTGGGAVRFNPNLYANGKVCLSLLGTWQGRGGENWNPKLSTFLQVLLSIQSLIMTEDIYYNEPGLEVYAGTPQGELENEGYSNVVRFCNIKYAMIEQMRSPPKGFETAIKRHFYLKKKEILDEVYQWIELSKTKDASYTGCQNYNWQNLFGQSKTKYQEMLTEIVKELEEELNKLPPPVETTEEESHVQQVKRARKPAKTHAPVEEKPLEEEEIDVTYDKDVKSKELDITDDAVKDRWSRYIGAMGIEAVMKQANSSVLLSGLGPLGVEIAKNITLSGVKRLTLHDSKKVVLNELAGQFLLEESDVGKNRVTASLNKLQQLNFYVKIDTVNVNEELPKEEGQLESLIGSKNYNLVIATETDNETLIMLDKFCRTRGIAFIAADVYGPFSRIFCDFGDEFLVVDKDGEEVREVLIKSISNEEQGLVTLLESNRHNFEDGDQVLITEVVGMQEINETKHRVKVVNAHSFRIGDTTTFTPYSHNGKVRLIKNPVVVRFKSFEEAMKNPQTSLDQNLAISDFTKASRSLQAHILFETLDETRKHLGRLPKPWNSEESENFVKLAKLRFTEAQVDEKLISQFASTCSGIFAPLAAFIGGFVSQEAVKALTNKFMPINQLFYTDCTEVIPQEQTQLVQKSDRYDGLRVCIGDELFQKLTKIKLFMVGVGAIGCELLKNFAMLGIGTAQEGELTITDPDVIETSNLNRQFLFREKHLRKPKSQTAAASVVQMNKDLKGKIYARLDKVHPGSAHIFTDKFFEDVDVVANALDNVQARRYIDMRCVKAKTPLLESGTLGPKGHVQVVVPYKTESYGSQEDPQDEQEIPHCTLKMFPEETLHCVEWARDKFGKLFSQKPRSLAKLLEDTEFAPTNMQELQTLKQAVKLLKKMPTNFDDCIRYARHKFQKYFVNDIRQLLFTYPLEHKTKQGTPFWSSPKRPPTEIPFDQINLLHASFIVAAAVMWATIFGVPIPSDCSKEQVKLKLAQEASEIKVKDFKPSNEKAQELATEVELEQNKQAAPEDKPKEEFVYSNEFEVYQKQFQELVASLPKDAQGNLKPVIFPQEFEKDNDKNFHIEFIYSLANCRANNYKLEPMDWMTVKLKAGRIVPALATTTASIAGLQTIELCKMINQNKVEDMKNAFLNFAVPYLTLSEPGPVQTIKLTENLSVTLWDRWEISLSRKDSTLKQLFAQVRSKYQLECRDVMHEGRLVYLHNVMELPGRESEKENALSQPLESLLDVDENVNYVDLTITFCRITENKILEGTPEVRVKFI